jgi:hypothetical protein
VPDDTTQSVKRLYELSVKPSAPPAGVRQIYCKTDGKWYEQDSAGTETEIGSGGGGGTSTDPVTDPYLLALR